ncbi:DNA/RNA non-specific endonuclease [Aetokthonos hydrillicola]|uniref:DNA/RNA non-specific endonuclease n=1 Tax=Aetokthonos hydrillicola TaxID=1550245 RepID=UPI0036F3D3B7
MVLDRPGASVTANTRVIAVNVPNQQGINYDWRAYRVSVKTLEGLTGYHFFDGVKTEHIDKLDLNPLVD